MNVLQKQSCLYQRMVKVEISIVAFQQTITNVLTAHKFQFPLCSAGGFPWTSGGTEVDYMSLVTTNSAKSQEVMHFFLEGFCLSLYLLISQFFIYHIHTYLNCQWVAAHL